MLLARWYARDPIHQACRSVAVAGLRCLRERGHLSVAVVRYADTVTLEPVAMKLMLALTGAPGSYRMAIPTVSSMNVFENKNATSGPLITLVRALIFDTARRSVNIQDCPVVSLSKH